MPNSSVGRNDPCPCGSGKKYKYCCLEKDELFARKTNGDTPPRMDDPGMGPAWNSWNPFNSARFVGFDDPMATLRAALEDKVFDSEEELHTFAESVVAGLNSKPYEHFHGLSPEQMYCVLYAPFDSPQVVTFPEVLPSVPDTPVVRLVKLLIEAVGEEGLKATEKGNLPRAFCRAAAQVGYVDELPRIPIPPDRIQRETDLPDLQRIHFAMLDAGLLRKTKGRFHLTRKCLKTLKKAGLAGIYPLLLKSYAGRVEWGYWDGFPQYSIIQDSFLFSLYLLQRDGGSPRPESWYEDRFLAAYPTALDLAVSRTWREPESDLRMCYSTRMLERFAAFFGLIGLQEARMDDFNIQYTVTAQPLLYEAVQFHI